MIATRRKIHFARRERGRKVLADGSPTPDSIPIGRVPRIARLLALAIRLDRMVRDGNVEDLSELARLARVSQPRMTQILNLTLLAPEIQEELLCLPRVTSGRERVHERMLRDIAGCPDWGEQRRRWRTVGYK